MSEIEIKDYYNATMKEFVSYPYNKRITLLVEILEDLEKEQKVTNKGVTAFIEIFIFPSLQRRFVIDLKTINYLQ